jgi:hypothetical protein
MGQPHPTLTLILDIDKRLDSAEAQQEIKRDYAYVGSTLIRTHEAASEDAPIENTMHVVLKLGRRQYLYSKDEGADELWNDFLEHWFYNAFFKLGNHMKIYNRRQREIGMPELVFDWLELELQNGKLRVRMHTDSNSDILPNTNEWLTTIRSALNAGALGENYGAEIEQITMPSPEFYAKQLEEGIRIHKEKLAQEEAQRAAKEEEERLAKEQAEAQAEEAFLESPELVAAALEAAEAAKDEDGDGNEVAGKEAANSATGEGTADGKEAAGSESAACADGATYDGADGAYEGGESVEGEGDRESANAGDGAGETSSEEDAEEAEAEEEEEEEPVLHVSDFNHEAYKQDADYSFEEPLFALDYSVWTIEYIDGSTRVYDSNKQEFIN